MTTRKHISLRGCDQKSQTLLDGVLSPVVPTLWKRLGQSARVHHKAKQALETEFHRHRLCFRASLFVIDCQALVFFFFFLLFFFGFFSVNFLEFELSAGEMANLIKTFFSSSQLTRAKRCTHTFHPATAAMRLSSWLTPTEETKRIIRPGHV